MADSSTYDANPASPRDRDRDRPAMGHHPAGASANAGTTGGGSIEDRSRSPGAPPLRPDIGGNGLPLQAPPRQHNFQSHNNHHQGGGGPTGAGGHVIPANPDHLTLRALVTTKEAGVVIGKQGANIKSIREDSNARINISEHVQGVHERILSITGAIEEVAKAYAQVSRNLNAGDLRTATPDAVEATPLTIRFLIPNSRMGSVIGKGGARIKEIQDESNARLAAQPTPLPNSHDRILEMIGVPDAIHIATYHMLVTIKEHSDRPLNDRPYRPEYGVGGNSGGPHGGGGYHQPQMQGGGGHMQGGGYGGGNPGGSSYYAPQGQGQGQYYTPQQPQAHYGGGGQGQGGYNNNQQQYQPPQIANGPTDTRTFYCPANKVGSMIGRGGQKINRIRTESGCRINVEDARGERGDRPFVVTGPAHAVERAIATLEQALRRELKRDEEALKAGGGVGGGAAMQ